MSCNPSNFKIEHETPAKFYSSQWDKLGRGRFQLIFMSSYYRYFRSMVSLVAIQGGGDTVDGVPYHSPHYLHLRQAGLEVVDLPD